MKTIDKVELVLRSDQRFRNSDKELLLFYWERQGLVLTKEQRQIFLDKCTTAETITRARRALKDKYPATEAIDNARFAKYKEYRFNRAYTIVED